MSLYNSLSLPRVDDKTNEKAMRAILNGVDYLVTKEIRNAPFNKVYTGVIKTINSDNTYDLTIDGNEYEGVPSLFKASFAENDTVKVISPQNQMSNIFILGKLNMEVSGSTTDVSVSWDKVSDKPSGLVEDTDYVHTDENYTTLEKQKLESVESGAQKNTVTGIKGSAETEYRQGDVNITKANIGLENVDNTADVNKSVENASKLNNQTADYYATAKSVTDETARAQKAETANSDAISAESSRAKGAENTLTDNLNAEIERAQKAEKVNSDAIDVLNGEATVEGSVAYKIAQIVDESDDGKVDTLKEIASWIDNNPNSATAMQKQITDNKSTIDTHIKDTLNPHGVTKAQVGLGNVDNTSDLEKPISTATQTALNLKANGSDLKAHTGNTSNPHKVTASQVGLGNVPNVSTNNQTPTYTKNDALSALVSGEKLSIAFGKIAKAISDLIGHIANKSNPHGVTKTQLGLGNVTNYDQSDAIKSIVRNGLTYTYTKLDGTTDTFTQQDTNTTYTLTQSATDGHILTFTPSNGDAVTITIPDNNTTYELASDTVNGLMSSSDKSKLDGIESGAQKNTVTGVKGGSESSYRKGNVNITKANLGLGNVTNYDQSTAIKNITRNGLTFTATRLDGATFTFTQQDNDTKALGSMTGTLGVAHGGTGATSASGARTNLGIGTLGTRNYLTSADIKLKFVDGNTLQILNSQGTVIASVVYTPKIEWNQNTATSYVWNE